MTGSSCKDVSAGYWRAKARRGGVPKKGVARLPEWIAPLFLPLAGLLLVVVVIVASTAYFWLYPERHAHVLDFSGTEEERRALVEFRRALARKPLLRRLAEKLRIVPSNDPPWPGSERDAP